MHRPANRACTHILRVLPSRRRLLLLDHLRDLFLFPFSFFLCTFLFRQILLFDGYTDSHHRLTDASDTCRPWLCAYKASSTCLCLRYLSFLCLYPCLCPFGRLRLLLRLFSQLWLKLRTVFFQYPGGDGCTDNLDFGRTFLPSAFESKREDAPCSGLSSDLACLLCLYHLFLYLCCLCHLFPFGLQL